MGVLAPMLLVTAIMLQTFPGNSGKRGCTFKHGGCTYNIRLNQERSKKAKTELNECGTREENVFLDSAQNDYTAKIDGMKKDLTFLRKTHEQRLKELENSVKDLLGLDVSGKSLAEGDRNVDISKTGSHNFFNNEDLMRRLEEEFNQLREEIRQKSRELIDTSFKLNETSTMMHEAQLQHFQTSQQLVKAENEITTLNRERAVLKNQLKDRTYKLNVSNTRVSECEAKSTDQQDQIVKLFRSENTLKEELMTVQLQLNESRLELSQLKDKLTLLKATHERTLYVLRVREHELIDCFQSKTSTFCGFEDPKICGFTNINDTSDRFDWEWGMGTTPSDGTGPSKDHTCNGPYGHFMFIEASAKGRGHNAILYSPLYRGRSEQCVEFFYHMHGRHIGTLNVYAQARGDVLNSAWRAFGNQGNVWTSARLAIPQELAMAGYQIAFEGITESGYQGDISIDDVSVTDGPCPVDEKVVPVPVMVNSTKLMKKIKAMNRKILKRTPL